MWSRQVDRQPQGKRGEGARKEDREERQTAVTHSKRWPPRVEAGEAWGLRGDTSERWASSRPLPDDQGSDCCSVSAPLSLSLSVCALVQSLMTGERFLGPYQSDQCLSTPDPDPFQLMYYWRSIPVRCWLGWTGLNTALPSFTEQLWAFMSDTRESVQRSSKAFQTALAKFYQEPETIILWCILHEE